MPAHDTLLLCEVRCMLLLTKLLDLGLLQRIEEIVINKLITLKVSDIVLLFACRSRLSWKLRGKLAEDASKKQDYIRNAVSQR